MGRLISHLYKYYTTVLIHYTKTWPRDCSSIIHFSGLPAVAAKAHAAHEPRHEMMSLLEKNSLVLEITGMTCAGCASHVEKALLGAPGVHKADVSYAEGTARVSGEGALDPAELSAAVRAAGYGVALEKSAHAGGPPDGARAFGGKLKTAGGGHGEPRDFCYGSAKAAVPQAFLETDEDRRLIARLDIDHAIGHEPGLREGRGEQILPGETPEHLATQPRAPV
jgi:copper chaperone CopZ